MAAAPNLHPILAAVLRGAELDFSKAIGRLQRFLALAQTRPRELRELLDKHITFNEVFQRLPLPVGFE